MTFFDSLLPAALKRGIVFPVLAWLLASLIAGIAGPLGTYESMPLAMRLGYWSALIGVAVALGLGIRLMVVRVMGRSDGLSDMVGPVIMAPVFGGMVTLFNGLVLGRTPLSWDALWWNIGVVALVCWGVVLVRVYVRWVTAPEGAAASGIKAGAQDGAVAAGPVPVFLQDVAPEIRDGFRWIEADDHYLRVHARDGRSERVLMRFRDALEHLSDVPGVRVHRSHWVRTDAITDIRPDGKRHKIVLPCGSEVPVSKTYLADLQAAGVMDGVGASGPPRAGDPEGSRVPYRP